MFKLLCGLILSASLGLVIGGVFEHFAESKDAVQVKGHKLSTIELQQVAIVLSSMVAVFVSLASNEGRLHPVLGPNMLLAVLGCCVAISRGSQLSGDVSHVLVYLQQSLWRLMSS